MSSTCTQQPDIPNNSNLNSQTCISSQNKIATAISSHIRYPVAIRPGTVFWTKEEDAKLIGLVMKHGKNWRLMRDYFPRRTESSIKCRWHVYLKQHVKGEPPEYKKQDGYVPYRRAKSTRKPRKKRKPLVSLTNLDLSLGSQMYEDKPRKSSRVRSKPKITYSTGSPVAKSSRGYKSRGQVFRKRYPEIVVSVPGVTGRGGFSEREKLVSKKMSKKIARKNDLELTPQEKCFFREYAYEPRNGTPMAQRVSAINCLATSFFTKPRGAFVQLQY
eukprot:maker-scaffold_19-snap-gene-4.43-mRNA-1 protein AED:0.00 eAED:0.00 QI:80/1/1/1/1/1/4/175/272